MSLREYLPFTMTYDGRCVPYRIALIKVSSSNNSLKTHYRTTKPSSNLDRTSRRTQHSSHTHPLHTPIKPPPPPSLHPQSPPALLAEGTNSGESNCDCWAPKTPSICRYVAARNGILHCPQSFQLSTVCRSASGDEGSWSFNIWLDRCYCRSFESSKSG